MSKKTLTDSEILLLGLIAEMPRHGYQLEQVIKQRGMREWTQIGYSSIYFVLGKLEKLQLISATVSKEARAKKTYALSELGHEMLLEATLASLASIRPTYSSALLGMLHWPLMEHAQAIDALENRTKSAMTQIERLQTIRAERQPLPDYVEALFEFSIEQLNAESAWVERTLDYMKHRP